MRTEAFEEGLLLVASVRAALANGVVHRDEAGNLLADERAIIEHMVAGGEVALDESAREERVTVESVLAALRAETTIH